MTYFLKCFCAVLSLHKKMHIRYKKIRGKHLGMYFKHLPRYLFSFSVLYTCPAGPCSMVLYVYWFPSCLCLLHKLQEQEGTLLSYKDLIFNFLFMTLVAPHWEEIWMSCHMLSHVIKQSPLCHTSSLLSFVAQQNNHVIKRCSILHELQKHIMNFKRLLIGFRSHHQCRAEDELAHRMRSNFSWCFWEGSCAVFNNNSITVIDSSIEHRADVNAMLHQDSMVMSHWHCLNLVL